MKFAKPRYSALFFLYLPITACGIALGYFFPDHLIKALQFCAPIFLIFALLLVLTRGKQTLSIQTKPFSFWRQLILWFCLQSGVTLILLVILTTLATPTQNPALLSTAITFYLKSGLFPWPLYLLLGIAFAYFGQKYHLSLTRSALWPVFRGKLTSTFGLGIDFYVKQGVILTSTLALSISIIACNNQIIQLLDLPISLQQPMSSLVIGTFISFLLASEAWQRCTRYFCLKHYSASLLLGVYIILFGTIMILSEIGLRYLKPYFIFPSLFQPLKPWPQLPSTLTDVHLLLLICWEILLAPLIATFIARLTQGQTLYTVVFSALVFPCCIAFILGLDHYYWQNAGFIKFSNLLAIHFISLLLALIALSLLIIFFKNPDVLQIAHLINPDRKHSPYPTLASQRNFLILMTTLFFIYSLFGAALFTLFAAGIAIIIFAVAFMTCLSLLISLRYQKYSGSR